LKVPNNIINKYFKSLCSSM